MSTPWQAVLYVHLLAMAFFVGGQIFLAFAVVPVERRSPDPERLRAIARRFGIGSLAALLVLLGTGIAIAFHLDLWSSHTLQLKLALVALVIGLTLLHMRFPRRHAIEGAVFVVTLAIVWLGLELES